MFEPKSDITVIIVNRKTLNYTRVCIESLMRFYPYINVIIVDNDSNDDSFDYICKVADDNSNITCILSDTLHHAEGLNIGVEYVKTAFFLTLDSDVKFLRGGLLEQMLFNFKKNIRLLACGHVCMNAGPSCVSPPTEIEYAHNFVHPFCAMWDTKKFNTLAKTFQKTGQPACNICKVAQEKGMHLQQIPGLHTRNKPMPYYVYHKWGGTRDTLAIMSNNRRKLK